MTAFPAGPAGGLFGFKNIIEFNRDPLGFMTYIGENYGDIVHHMFGPYHLYMMNHPDYIHQLLVTEAKKFHKWDQVMKPWRKVFGTGLVSSEGDYWRRQRKLMQPVFHAKKIRSFADLIAQHTQKMLDGWQSGAEYNIAHEMMTLTMGIIAQIIFNVDVVEDAKHIGEAFTTSAEMVMLESTNILHAPDWMPTPRNLRENRAMQDLRDFLGGIIEERRKSDEDKGDLLSMLLAARDEDGEGMTDEQIYDELVTLFAAGHETSANTLNWLWVLLSQNPDEEAKLVEQVKSALNGKAPTFEDLEKMPRLEMALKETMRVYPTLWIWQREALEDVEIGGYTIPKGGVAYVSPWAMHHHPRFWTEPQKFDPERFSPEREKEIPDYAYFPFGGGPRVCIGNHLAMMEMQIIAAMLLRRFKLERVSNEPIEVEPLIAIRPKGGLPMRVTAR